MRRLYARWVRDWDERLANAATNRTVRSFDWGLEWAESWPNVPARNGHAPGDWWREVGHHIVADSDAFYRHDTPTDFRLVGDDLRFTSNVATPHPENNTVHARLFAAPGDAAVVVLPHWNSPPTSYLGLCRLIQRIGITALRVSLPYHDARMPGELNRADYAVSSNVGRTIDATRQAVLDARGAFDWLEQSGKRRLGIVGTSLGSCYAFLVSAHDPRVRVNAFNHCSTYFADVVWTGLATRHIRESLDTATTLEELRAAWLGISPLPYVECYARQQKESLFLYAAYDTSFLPEFSREIIGEIRRAGAKHRTVALPCGHYTLGESPYKFMDGYHIARFLHTGFNRLRR